MGLLAPLQWQSQQAHRLTFSSGWGTFWSGAGLLAFGAVVLLMRWITAPLLAAVAQGDFLLGEVLPVALLTLGPILGLLGALLLGFRQILQADGSRKRLRTRISVFGVPLKSTDVDYGDIACWKCRNVTPKRYRAEDNLKNKPVGFWELCVETRDGKTLRLERAPYEREVVDLQERLSSFIQNEAGGAFAPPASSHISDL